MAVGIIIYQFDINQNENGEIEPEFSIISEVNAPNYEGPNISEFFDLDERFRLFFSHTTGLNRKEEEVIINNIMMGSLLETRNRFYSYYHNTKSRKQYITICLFEPDQFVELFESAFNFLTETLSEVFEEITDDLLRNAIQVNKLNRRLNNILKGTLYQIERLENLSKMQKAAMIHSTFERQQCLKILREGPIFKSNFAEKIKEHHPKANIDLLLSPFLELNIVKREWPQLKSETPGPAKKKQEEVLILVKDFVFIRKPPKKLYERIQKNRMIKLAYELALKEFYANYDPFEDVWKESEELAKIILKPEVFDLLALFQQNTYPVQKVPRVISEFGDIVNLLDFLERKKIITRIQDSTGVFWVCLLCEIHPMVIFPEYLISKIADRTSIKQGAISEDSLFAPLPKELGKLGLEILLSSYYEEVKFQEAE